MNVPRFVRAALAAGALALACSAATAQTAQQPVRMRIQTAVPSASIYFELLKKFGDRVDKMSGGRVKMVPWRTLDRWGPYLGWAEPYYG